ncbi:MAG: nuclear transport factor 2 family protein [Burkholderiaceae bacterium]|nr:nuclear transport factor 2 family protein [Burkholderiaceae bacterium]
MSTTELIDLYCEAWSDPDPVRRAELLRRVWSQDATYTDPTVHARGAEELLAHIAGVRERRPGSRVVRTSGVDEHHGLARFAWHAIEADGSTLPEGIDLAFLSSDGSRIDRIIGFFGPLKKG